MARVKTYNGLETFSRNLAKLGTVAEVSAVCKTALYDGAGVIADAVREEIQALPVGNERGTEDHKIKTIKQSQKDGLLNSLGIASMRHVEGFGYQASIGFDGYNNNTTRSYPNGQPNAMIAASIESGSSFRVKNPFITRALRKSQAKAEAAMQSRAEAKMNEIMEE